MHVMKTAIKISGVLSGLDSFLGTVDMLGSSFTDNTVATGFGLHLAQPILRKEWREGLTVAEGKAILEACMKVLFYRDGRTINRVRSAFAMFVSTIAYSR